MADAMSDDSSVFAPAMSPYSALSASAGATPSTASKVSGALAPTGSGALDSSNSSISFSADRSFLGSTSLHAVTSAGVASAAAGGKGRGCH